MIPRYLYTIIYSSNFLWRLVGRALAASAKFRPIICSTLRFWLDGVETVTDVLLHLRETSRVVRTTVLRKIPQLFHSFFVTVARLRQLRRSWVV